ncbi:YoaK family protein [Polyangium jinanense]|nr:YoaK family protein [Polyangium jinanense]MDC3962349.1 DUF1275 domain-containing protein [Polyangium jinanense]
MSVALHTPPTIFSMRHAPSWVLLALAAGSVNAGAFLACQRFVTHVTGLTTQLGIDAGLWGLMAEYGLVVLCFIAGAMSSVIVLQRRHQRGKPPLHAAPLIFVSTMLAGVAISGHAGLFGQFGTSVEQPRDFLLLSLLSFAMGLQNATVSTATGGAVRTTHMTGPATELGVQLASSFAMDGEARRTALQGAMLRGSKIIAFASGAALMVPAVRAGGYLAFLIPGAFIMTATVLSFIPGMSVDTPSTREPALSRGHRIA